MIKYKPKPEKPTYMGDFGRIIVEENFEPEFKLGIIFNPARSGFDFSTTPQRIIGDERRIASVGREIWDAYLPHRYAFEDRQKIGRGHLILADDTRIPSYRQEQKKEVRIRSFYILGQGEHPSDLEIRAEIVDGKKIIMLKKGNGASPENPVIRRRELKLTCPIEETVESALHKLPKKYKDKMGFSFGKHGKLYMPMQTNSMRLKSKVRFLFNTIDGPLIFVIEPAFDLGSGQVKTIDEDGKQTIKKWPIDEFEGEVKGVYQLDRNIDVKAHPEVIGLNDYEMSILCAEVLRPELEDLTEIAQGHLIKGARSDFDRYGDIGLTLIFESKSSPGLRLFRPLLEQGPKVVKRVLGQPNSSADTAPFVGSP